MPAPDSATQMVATARLTGANADEPVFFAVPSSSSVVLPSRPGQYLDLGWAEPLASPASTRSLLLSAGALASCGAGRLGASEAATRLDDVSVGSTAKTRAADVQERCAAPQKTQ